MQVPGRLVARPARGVLALGVLAGAALVAAAAEASAAPPPHNGKVTLCHARPPATAANGWVEITVSTNAVTHAGHGDHADDIIPAFTYYVKRTAEHYPGKNLATLFHGVTGAQILADGCALPTQPTSSVPAPSTSVSQPSQPAPTTTTITATHTHTVPVPRHSTATRTVHATTTATRSAAVVATSTAVVSGGQRGQAPQVRAAQAVPTTGIAAGDTGDRGAGTGPSAGVLAAVIGGGVAGLLGLAGLAYWRRRTSGAGA